MIQVVAFLLGVHKIWSLRSSVCDNCFTVCVVKAQFPNQNRMSYVRMEWVLAIYLQPRFHRTIIYFHGNKWGGGFAGYYSQLMDLFESTYQLFCFLWELPFDRFIRSSGRSHTILTKCTLTISFSVVSFHVSPLEQPEVFDEIDLLNLCLCECSTKNQNHSFQVSQVITIFRTHVHICFH